MIETKEVNSEDVGGEDLIPKEQLPTDPVELAKEPTVDGTVTGEESTDQPAPEEKVESSSAAPEEKPVVHSQQPAPVEGETAREKALRLEIQRLRGIKRKDDTKEIAEGANSVNTQTDKYEILRTQGYSDEDITKMETAIDVIASAKGYVRADRNYATTVQDTVELFTDAHPEYNPASDVDDVRWNLFQSFLKDGTYNLSGKTPKQLTAIFERVNTDVCKELGDVIVKTNPRQLAAQQHKVTVASHSGGTKSPVATPVKRDHTQVGGIKLIGFNEEDLD